MCESCDNPGDAEYLEREGTRGRQLAWRTESVSVIPMSHYGFVWFPTSDGEVLGPYNIIAMAVTSPSLRTIVHTRDVVVDSGEPPGKRLDHSYFEYVDAIEWTLEHELEYLQCRYHLMPGARAIPLEQPWVRWESLAFEYEEATKRANEMKREKEAKRDATLN